MNLVQTIEEIDTGHFARRVDILEDLREKVRALGFFPLLLTQNDIECFWIRLEPNGSNQNLKIRVSKDELELNSYINVLKDVAKHEK